MYLLGFACFWWLGGVRAKRDDIWFKDRDQVSDFLFYGALGVVLGGRVGYMLFYNTAAIMDNPFNILRIWEGGMSFHGGLLGVVIAMIWYARKFKASFYDVADFVCVLTPLGLLFGRIGNFINGELWGAPVAPDFIFGMVYEGVPRHPSMLYEAFFEGAVLFALLWWFTRKPQPLGAASGLFLFGYGVARFAVEFVRLPDEHIGYLAGGWLTMGHVLTLPVIAAGIAMLVWAYSPKRKEKNA
jgi:phosphatidylglycerol:prolipoprotein diacylglycerol transferase